MQATDIRRAEISAELPTLTPLLKTGIRILDDHGVQEYKQAKLAEARSIARGSLLRRIFSSRIKGLFRFAPDSGLVMWRSYEVGACEAGFLELKNLRAAGIIRETKIPREVRELCGAIATTGVRARFEVDQLDADPFMRVTSYFYDESYVIAVWDERGFIG